MFPVQKLLQRNLSKLETFVKKKGSKGEYKSLDKFPRGRYKRHSIRIPLGTERSFPFTLKYFEPAEIMSGKE